MSDTNTETKFSLESIVVKVQRLLAKAADPAITPQEAALFNEKAADLMDKYRIEASEARDRGEAPSMKPEWSEAFLYYSGSEWSQYYGSFAYMAARHCGVRIRSYSKWNSEAGKREVFAKVLGFGHDVAFFNLVFTNMVQSFAAKLDPMYDPAETLGANALRLRQGGMERGRIAQAIGLGEKSDPTLNEMKARNRRVTKLIKEEAERIGLPELAEAVLGRGFNAKTYRQSYAAGFNETLYFRLLTLKSNNVEGGLVLKRTEEEVAEAWYQEYPNERPSTDPRDRDYVAPEPCSKCAKAKSGSCRDHSYAKPRTKPMNWDAVERGRSAARTVDLGAVKAREVR